jgi:membrane protease YdiL (CAAX protease family)
MYRGNELEFEKIFAGLIFFILVLFLLIWFLPLSMLLFAPLGTIGNSLFLILLLCLLLVIIRIWGFLNKKANSDLRSNVQLN